MPPSTGVIVCTPAGIYISSPVAVSGEAKAARQRRLTSSANDASCPRVDRLEARVVMRCGERGSRVTFLGALDSLHEHIMELATGFDFADADVDRDKSA